jgi:uncharacterized protein (TIGR03492 family)
MRLLCLSNGHGEDMIAVRILQALQHQAPDAELAALPIVGEGHAYAKLQIPLIGTVKAMPSGGFIYMDGRQLARDLQGGLVQLTLTQLRAIQGWGRDQAESGPRGDRLATAESSSPSLILAVGDIVPLLFAWLSGVPYAFVGTAKSEYYLRDETGWLPRQSWWDDRLERWTGCIYHPWERWLLSRPHCKAVFPRDTITANILQQFGVPAVDLGNPMMDGLEWPQVSPQNAGDQHSEDNAADTGDPTTPPIALHPLTFALIPGSRIPEAYANWELILQALPGVLAALSRPLVLLAAIAPGLEADQLHQVLLDYRWQPTGEQTYQMGYGDQTATLELMPHRFAECLHRADLAIAMAGTATEQFVGLGKPVIAIVGQGPQFTRAFAEAQTRLLGASVTVVEQPSQVGAAIQTLLQDPDRLAWITHNGLRRMGTPGAAQRIAACLLTKSPARSPF